MCKLNNVTCLSPSDTQGIPVRSLPPPAAAGASLSSTPTPPSTRIARASSPGRRRGGQAEACFPWVSIVTLRAIDATCSHEYLCLNLRAIDDEKFEIVGFPGPTAGAGRGRCNFSLVITDATYRFPSRCAAGAVPPCSPAPSRCGIPSCLLAPVLRVLLQQAEEGFAVVAGRLLASIFV